MHVISIGHCACGKRGTLFDGLCGFCEDAADTPTGHLACPKPDAPMTVVRALDLLVAELVDDEIAAPLAQTFTLASVAADLCRLAGEPIPVAVLDALDGVHCAPTHLRPTERRGSFKEYEEQFYLPA
jgi:hypothetical protein